MRSTEGYDKDTSSKRQADHVEIRNNLMKVGDTSFGAMFYDIQEDHFESSGDEQEKDKNEKLLRLGRLAAE